MMKGIVNVVLVARINIPRLLALQYNIILHSGFQRQN